MHQLKEQVTAFGGKKKNNPGEEQIETDEQNLKEKLNEVAYLFKSIEYQYENEVRLVVKGVGIDKVIGAKKEIDKKYTTDFKEEPTTTKETENITNLNPPKVFVEMIDIRPFIQQITIGPKVNNKEEWASAFHYSLQNHYETQKITTTQPKILISHLPFK